MNQNQGRRRQKWVVLILWALFGAGLLVQVFAPRLKIQNNAFVVPSSLMPEAKDIRPAEIVARERRMQLLSGLLTLSGALGLAFHYRRVLVWPGSPSRESVHGSPQAS